MKKLLLDLKERGEDFEFYPTTERMARTVYGSIYTSSRSPLAVLDIGAGNGIFLKKLKAFDDQNKDYGKKFGKMYAIEKSRTLIEQMEPDVFVIGTDFHKQSLIDKQVDVIFCNPPYSEYEIWSARIISESNADQIILVIPDRWKESKLIADALKERNARTEVIGTDSFIDSEHRKARATVDIVKIKIDTGWKKLDPFNLWAEKHFFKQPEPQEGEERGKTKENVRELCKGRNLIERLAELYQLEIDSIGKAFSEVGKMDPKLLKDCGVEKESLIESMKKKYSGVKSLYWQELFGNLDKITSRLTFKTRQQMIDTLNGSVSVDFSAENAYSVVVWAIKQANQYIDQQAVDVFYWMANKDNITAYKSNKRMLFDNMRFTKENEKFFLDYRIVTRCSIFADNYWSENDGINRLNDALIIARNLGFEPVEDVFKMNFPDNYGRFKKYTQEQIDAGEALPEIKRGDAFEIHYREESGEEKVLVSCRSYQNGNTHMKFCVEFMRDFNVSVGRILRWINSPKEAAEEIGISVADATKSFAKNHRIGYSDIKLIG